MSSEAAPMMLDKAIRSWKLPKVRMSLRLDDVRAEWTTERNAFNNRDEVYFVVAGVSGSKKSALQNRNPARLSACSGGLFRILEWNRDRRV